MPIRSYDDDRDRDEILSTLEQQRQHKGMMARQLAEAALGEWRRTIEGLVAAPAAAALGMAAVTMMGVELVVAGFEAFQRSTGMLQQELERSSLRQRRMRGAEYAGREGANAGPNATPPPGGTPIDREPPRA